MTKKSAVAEQLVETSVSELNAEQVADYLKGNPDFFADHQDLLAELTLPHDSGEAVSLMERQVRILRERGIDARSKLHTLINNARDNDQLFEFTREIVLALLCARDVAEVVQVTEDRLTSQDNVDVCELILCRGKLANVPDTVRQKNLSELKKIFAKVFRLKRTYCGSLNEEQLQYLFGNYHAKIKSTALCPIIVNDEVLGLMAIGNHAASYFNVNLDTLFVDFIGNVVSAVLGREIADQ